MPARPGKIQFYRTCLPDVQRDVGKHRWGWTTEPDPRGFTDARSRLGAEPMVACARVCRDRALDMAKACVATERGPLGRPLASSDGTDVLLFETPGTRTRSGDLRDASGHAVGRPHGLMVCRIPSSLTWLRSTPRCMHCPPQPRLGVVAVSCGGGSACSAFILGVLRQKIQPERW
jgi:hypothetical protein